MGEVIEEADLPMNLTAYTACFRREKMSAGRDVRGMKRGHQFDKVEMYKYCKPENANQELDNMVADAAQTCKELGLTYRVLLQSTGDLSFGSHKTYDIEVWALAARNGWKFLRSLISGNSRHAVPTSNIARRMVPRFSLSTH